MAGSPQAHFQHALAAFSDGNDTVARQELLLIVKDPTNADAPRAHLYLGLIELNAFRTKAARAQFVEALRLDPVLELPLDASPKAEVLFQQARVSARRQPPPASSGAFAEDVPRETAPQPASPVEPLLLPRAVAQPAPPALSELRPAPRSGVSHIASISVGSAGLAGVIAGAVLLGVSASTLSQARNPQTFAASAQADTFTSAREQYAAEWCFGGGVALIGAAIVLRLLEGSSGSAGTDQVASDAEGKAF